MAVGPKACPFTTLYWDFIDRHQAMLSRNPRTGQQVRNFLNKAEAERVALRAQASTLRANGGTPALTDQPPVASVRQGLLAMPD